MKGKGMNKTEKKMHKEHTPNEYGLGPGVACPKMNSAGGPRHDGIKEKAHAAAYGRGGKKRA